jgi:hypothetical protein
MLKTYIVVKQYYFLAAGTILKEAAAGHEYFVSMSDSDFLRSRIVGRPIIDADTVEENKEHFLDVTGKEQDIPDLSFREIEPEELGPSATFFVDDGYREELRKLGNYAVGVGSIDPLNTAWDQFKGAENVSLLEVSPPCANHAIPETTAPPQTYKIPTPHPSKWPGAYVVSKYKTHTHYGSLPAGTIFKLDSRLTVNKHMKALPCKGCGAEFASMFKGSREAFLKSFYFVVLSETSDVPFTQAVLLGGHDEE